jgi:hypothetical protein
VDVQLSYQLLKQKADIRFNIADLLNQYTIIYSNNINKDAGGGYPGSAENNDPKGLNYNEAFDFMNYKAKKGTAFSVSLTYKL